MKQTSNDAEKANRANHDTPEIQVHLDFLRAEKNDCKH